MAKKTGGAAAAPEAAATPEPVAEPEPVEEAAPEPAAAPEPEAAAPADDGDIPTDIDGILAWCREHDG